MTSQFADLRVDLSDGVDVECVSLDGYVRCALDEADPSTTPEWQAWVVRQAAKRAGLDGDLRPCAAPGCGRPTTSEFCSECAERDA